MIPIHNSGQVIPIVVEKTVEKLETTLDDGDADAMARVIASIPIECNMQVGGGVGGGCDNDDERTQARVLLFAFQTCLIVLITSIITIIRRVRNGGGQGTVHSEIEKVTKATIAWVTSAAYCVLYKFASNNIAEAIGALSDKIGMLSKQISDLILVELDIGNLGDFTFIGLLRGVQNAWTNRDTIANDSTGLFNLVKLIYAYSEDAMCDLLTRITGRNGGRNGGRKRKNKRTRRKNKRIKNKSKKYK